MLLALTSAPRCRVLPGNGSSTWSRVCPLLALFRDLECHFLSSLSPLGLLAPCPAATQGSRAASLHTSRPGLLCVINLERPARAASGPAAFQASALGQLWKAVASPVLPQRDNNCDCVKGHLSPQINPPQAGSSSLFT